MDAQQTNKQNLELIIRDLQQRVQLLETSPSLPGLQVVGNSGLSGPNSYLGNPISVSNTSFSTLSGVLPGYTVNVSPSGRILANFGSYVAINTSGAIHSNGSVAFSIGLSGANTVDVATIPQRAVFGIDPETGTAMSFDASIASSCLFTGLLPGKTTVQLYVTTLNSAGATAIISNYWMWALAP